MRRPSLRAAAPAFMPALLALLSACGTAPVLAPSAPSAPSAASAPSALSAPLAPSSTATRPASWAPPEVLVAPSAGVHSLVIDPKGLRLTTGDGQAFDPAEGRFAVPAGMKIEGNDLWVADVFGLRRVDVRTGEVRDILRTQRDPDLAPPFAVGLSAQLFALSSWVGGTVQLVDRQTLKTVDTLRGLKTPFDAVPMPDGSVIYAEFVTGSITRASGPNFADRLVLASGLSGPVQMVVGQDGALYVTEAAGKLLRIPLDASAPLRTVADGLSMPEGLAQTPWGSFVVAESAARRLVEIDPVTGTRRTVADNLPIGLAPGHGQPPPYVVTGVAVGGDGTVYVSADRRNSIYLIRAVRQRNNK